MCRHSWPLSLSALLATIRRRESSWSHSRPFASSIGVMLLGSFVLFLVGCDSNSAVEPASSTPNPAGASCAIPTSNFADGGVGKDGIPALSDPSFVDANAAEYLTSADRIIGFKVAGEAYAVPHNILWWHEIANLSVDSLQLAVTYCPLTGSSLAFDRSVIDGGEFGVSGLLFNNNLTMYDRTSQESLWPQMNRQAGCGPRTGTRLKSYPVMEMTWGGWQALYPETQVVSSSTGFERDYTASGYPYGDYEERNNERVLFEVPLDDRRPPKERVLGVPDAEGGTAYPFGLLDDGTSITVINDIVGNTPVVVLWSADSRGAMAYRPVVEGQTLAFEDRNETIVDTVSGSTWTVTGTAISGPLAGTQLEGVADAYVAFWFAWALFQPDTEIGGDA